LTEQLIGLFSNSLRTEVPIPGIVLGRRLLSRFGLTNRRAVVCGGARWAAAHTAHGSLRSPFVFRGAHFVHASPLFAAAQRAPPRAVVRVVV